MRSTLVPCGQRGNFTQEAREAVELRDQMWLERPLEEGTPGLQCKVLVDLTFHLLNFNLPIYCVVRGARSKTERDRESA